MSEWQNLPEGLFNLKRCESICGECWRQKVISILRVGCPKSHFLAPENANFVNSERQNPKTETTICRSHSPNLMDLRLVWNELHVFANLSLILGWLLLLISQNQNPIPLSPEGHYDVDILHHLVQWRIAHWSLKPTMSQCDSSFSGGKCSLFFPPSFVEMWTHRCSSAGSYVLGATTCPQSIKESCLQASAG